VSNVDDLVVTGPDREDINIFKEEMTSVFQMSDLGLLRYYLGIEVKQCADGIMLSQGVYVVKILEKVGMTKCNSRQTPMESRLKLSKNSNESLVDATTYRSIIGSLHYLVNTHPDIAFAVGYVSRFLAEQPEDHMVVMKHILRYIAGTVDWGLHLKKGNGRVVLLGFSDSDFADDVDSRKSTTGVLFFLNQSPISWQSTEKNIVAQSSCEVEYVAAANATCQALWLHRVLGELEGLEPVVPSLKVDNCSAVALICNPVLSGRSKHIEVKYHLLRESAEQGQIEVGEVRTDDQLGDILTKALRRLKFQEMRSRIGMINVGSQHDQD
jgi:hypothetical protein